MNLIYSIQSTLYAVIVVIIILVIIIGALLFYLLKVKKIRSVMKTIDYNNFNREDSLEYVKFEDIVSSTGTNYDDESLHGAGMIVVGDNTFVGGISVIGYNFYDSGVDEQQSTMAHMLGFANLIESPIQIRQTTKAIDLSYNKEIFEDITRDKKRITFNLEEDYKELKRHAEDCADDNEEFEATLKKMDEITLELRSENFLLGVSKGLNRYIDLVSGNGANMQRVHNLMFTYVYDPTQYSTEMSQSEIYLTALRELELKELSFSQSLTNAGCTCERLSERDLTDAIRKHYHPVTADELSLSDILDSSFTSLYVTSSSLLEMERQKRGDAKLQKEIEEYNQYMQERLRKEAMKTARQVSQALSAVSEMVDKEDADNGSTL